MRSRLTSIFRQKSTSQFLTVGLTGGLIAGYLFSKHKPIVHAESKTSIIIGERKPALPTFSMTEVAKHTTKENGYWLAYKDGVYDVSSFVENHPGGKQILKTAGKALEACWKVFTIHQIDHVYEILEEYRIGNLPPGEREANAKAQEEVLDLFQYDPERINANENFFIRSERPYNAETKPSILVSSFITPVEKFYVRNHMHVPFVNINEYKLEIGNEKSAYSLSYDDLKDKYQSYTITSAIQCSGNRRSAMNNEEQGTVQGTPWYVGAIGNGTWTGVKLRDVLESFGLDKEGKHVQFIGLDCDTSQRCYGASIPIEKALSDDVLIAYKMNDEVLTTDHGYPLRIVVPGTVGARSVKWVNRIVVSDKESDSHWQKADYKVLPSSIKQPQQVDYDREPALQEFNVQSAICYPASSEDGNKVKILSIKPNDEDIKNQKLTIKGYAVSGGGRQIQNVQISLDHGKTWFQTELEQLAQPYMGAYAWTLWTYRIPLNDLPSKPFDVMCRAMDTHANSQPDTPLGIWNIRGVMNNSWHKITLQIDQNFPKSKNQNRTD
ncbi:unnamed protein product [Adineta steineri]|uniref:sulfite oxidase n=1 Tax=Adineta steineri TaxID=433720 RepID=A0A814SRZ7_9BILA|nr:unnamed protein product [Adineta steineri]CAF3920931.1 unnamed protein product [Adineta steineri]